ncbi:bacteriocin immunity protein [Streptococcus oralis]|uniref:bacteriocin immunity protein n=1 Tax=Streptococcus oralis TaxID=1303 RepID=UPI00077D90E1|nr:bacteriocin immunity protein [Streptococcus oralis]
MGGLKWFSGGTERRREAIAILEELIQSIKYDSQFLPLEEILISYKCELKDGGTSIPYVLSRMNVEISHALIDNALHLSASQSNLIRKLRELSNIRYGY